MSDPRQPLQLIAGDCRRHLAELAADSVDLVLTDPPYFKVKGHYWDRQWEDRNAFLAWLDEILGQLARVLKPAGSLYLFASPELAGEVGQLTAGHLAVLNHIRWLKADGWHQKMDPQIQRRYLTPWEAIIFAEHYGAEQAAVTAGTYQTKCAHLRGQVFEPLRAYLAEEWARAGLTAADADQATASQMAGHYFTASQWALPTEKAYQQLRDYAKQHGRPEVLAKDHQVLPRDYDDLRAEYERLRRPFAVAGAACRSDTWDFEPVRPYAGKHPCEKPLPLLEHIITTSSRPGDLVLDCFMGTGNTALAAGRWERDFLGIEMDPDYFATAQRRARQDFGLLRPLAERTG